METTIEIQGIEGLDRKLLALETSVAKRLGRKALRAGANLIHAQAKSNAGGMVGGRMGGLIAQHLKIQAFRASRTGILNVGVVIDKAGNEQFVYLTKRKAPGTRYYIPAAIERGHKTPKTRRRIFPIAFMLYAAHAKAQPAAQEIARTLGRELEQEATK